MKSATNVRRGVRLGLITIFLAATSLCNQLWAQCTINTPSSVQGCNGMITFNASSNSTTVNHHIWYDQFFNAISPTTENKIEYQPGTGQVAWVSTLTVSLTANATYYVAASCNTADKRAVTFTSQNGTPISLSMSQTRNPAELCAGETITLTAGNGSNFQWRFNNPNDASFTSGTTRVATQSGTYYLRGTNACGIQQTNQITLNFKPTLSGITITGGVSTLCQTSSTTQYTAGVQNYDYVSWSITVNDPNANASINSTGLVSWNNIVGQATITMTAYGCHGTSSVATRNVTITPAPSLAQCTIGSTNSFTGCSAPKLTATSTSSSVTSHKWFTAQSGGTEVGISRQGPSPVGGTWISELDGPFTQTTTYWIEPQCGCNTAGTRVPVTFTLDPGSVIGLSMNPVTNPADLCVGENVTLTASGGTAYEWRLNDPNKPTADFSSTSITVSQSGTYYLKGLNTCGLWRDGNSIALNFKQPMMNIALNGPDIFCQATPTTQFTTGGSNYSLVTWSITDTDPAASATINSSGLVTWNNISTNATITMTAYGCHGSSIVRTKTVTVDKRPNGVAVTMTQPNFCQGLMSGTQFNATGNNVYRVTWAVSGTGNTINENGYVIWGSGFTGTATVTATFHGCGGSTATATKSLTIYTNPVATTTPSGTVTIPFGTPSTTLTAGGGTGYTFQWFKYGSPITGQTSATHVATGAGDYSVRVTNANGCAKISAPVAVVFSSNYNYIMENTLQADRHASGTAFAETDIRGLAVEQREQKTTFYDGIGRSMQIVTKQASPLRNDVVQPVVNDAFSRETFKYLPIAFDNTGAYKEQIIDKNTNAYINGAAPFYAIGSNNQIADDTKPYSKTVFDGSPLNRVLKQGDPGSVSQPDDIPYETSNDHATKISYEANVANEVLLWTYSTPTATYPMGLVNASSAATPIYYTQKTLTKTKTKDADQHEVIEFQDSKGRTILKKIMLTSSEYAQTYYIYVSLYFRHGFVVAIKA